MYFIDYFVYFKGFVYITPRNLETPKIMIRELNHTNSSSNRLLCKLFGHKYKLIKKYRSNHSEYECCNCKNQFTQDDNGSLTPLTPKLRHINEVLEKLYLNKLERQHI